GDVEPKGLRYGKKAGILVEEAFGFHRSCGDAEAKSFRCGWERERGNAEAGRNILHIFSYNPQHFCSNR
ncbi:MAG: hypothetical protein IKS78_06280, partial [Clostridia bacterium]|nr:hypothetical protein [Clostridia bacterium]